MPLIITATLQLFRSLFLNVIDSGSTYIIFVTQFYYCSKMADGLMEVDFSAQWLADKIMISGVNECKCCLNLKRELKEIQEELSSSKLTIKLLQTEDSTNEHVGHGTIEPRNSIQSNELNTEKTKENKWIEVISSHHRRTKQEKIDPGKRQIEIENRYKVLENLQEPIQIADDLEVGKI